MTARRNPFSKEKVLLLHQLIAETTGDSVGLWEVNGIRLGCTNEDVVKLGLGVADGSMDCKALLDWVREHRI